MKNWKKLFKEAKQIIKKEGYIKREKLIKLKEKHNINWTLLLKKLLENKMPCYYKKHATLLQALGIHLQNNVIQYIDFCKLGEWRNELFINSKIVVQFKCKECGTNAKLKLKNILQRKYMVGEPICAKCILKVVTNTMEWKNINSEAQLVAQNKPEQIEKNKQAQIERHTDPVMKLKHQQASKEVWNRPGYREKMQLIAKKKWDDPEYAKKVIENSKSKFKTGMYKGIYYQSSYELAFLLQEEEKNNLQNITRANCYIQYVDVKGIIRHYYPDFLINNKILIEVKGYGPWIDLENTRRKHIAAGEWCKLRKIQFRLVVRSDLGYPLIRKAIKIHNELQ